MIVMHFRMLPALNLDTRTHLPNWILGYKLLDITLKAQFLPRVPYRQRLVWSMFIYLLPRTLQCLWCPKQVLVLGV